MVDDLAGKLTGERIRILREGKNVHYARLTATTKDQMTAPISSRACATQSRASITVSSADTCVAERRCCRRFLLCG